MSQSEPTKIFTSTKISEILPDFENRTSPLCGFFGLVYFFVEDNLEKTGSSLGVCWSVKIYHQGSGAGRLFQGVILVS